MKINRPIAKSIFNRAGLSLLIIIRPPDVFTNLNFGRQLCHDLMGQGNMRKSGNQESIAELKVLVLRSRLKSHCHAFSSVGAECL